MYGYSSVYAHVCELYLQVEGEVICFHPSSFPSEVIGAIVAVGQHSLCEQIPSIHSRAVYSVSTTFHSLAQAHCLASLHFHDARVQVHGGWRNVQFPLLPMLTSGPSEVGRQGQPGPPHFWRQGGCGPWAQNGPKFCVPIILIAVRHYYLIDGCSTLCELLTALYMCVFLHRKNLEASLTKTYRQELFRSIVQS